MSTIALGCLPLCPILALYHSALPALPVDVWLFLFSAGFFQAVYCTSLASAYRTGDLSIAYPLVRSSPIIVVTIAVFLLGRGEQIRWLSIAALIAACATAGYSIIDDQALRLLQAGVERDMFSAGYIYALGFSLAQLWN